MAAPPSEAELAEFQAQASLSMAFLRNLVGKHVAGYTPPTAEELAQADSLPQATISASQQLVRKLTAKPGHKGRSNADVSSSAGGSYPSTSYSGRQAPGPGAKPYGQAASKGRPASYAGVGTSGSAAADDGSSSDDEDSRALSVGNKKKRSAGDAFGGSGRGKKKASGQPTTTTSVAGVSAKKAVKGGQGKVHPAILLLQQQQQQRPAAGPSLLAHALSPSASTSASGGPSSSAAAVIRPSSPAKERSASSTSTTTLQDSPPSSSTAQKTSQGPSKLSSVTAVRPTAASSLPPLNVDHPSSGATAAVGGDAENGADRKKRKRRKKNKLGRTSDAAVDGLGEGTADGETSSRTEPESSLSMPE